MENKTINKVNIFRVDSMYDTIDQLCTKNMNGTEAEEKIEEILLKIINKYGLYRDTENDLLIGYDIKPIEELDNLKIGDYLDYIQYWNSSDDRITIGENYYNNVSIGFDDVYDYLCEKADKIDSVFKQEDIENLLTGKLEVDKYTHKLLKETAFHMIKNELMTKLQAEVDKITIDDIEWV